MSLLCFIPPEARVHLKTHLNLHTHLISRDFIDTLNIRTDGKIRKYLVKSKDRCIRILMRLQRDFETIVYSNGPVFRSADDDLYQHVYKNIKVIDTTVRYILSNKTMSVALCTSDLAGRQITCCSK